MGTYLKLSETKATKTTWEKLEIFDGDLLEDIAYNKKMGWNVRYFRIREIKIKEAKQ